MLNKKHEFCIKTSKIDLDSIGLNNYAFSHGNYSTKFGNHQANSL